MNIFSLIGAIGLTIVSAPLDTDTGNSQAPVITTINDWDCYYDYDTQRMQFAYTSSNASDSLSDWAENTDTFGYYSELIYFNTNSNQFQMYTNISTIANTNYNTFQKQVNYYQQNLDGLVGLGIVFYAIKTGTDRYDFSIGLVNGIWGSAYTLNDEYTRLQSLGELDFKYSHWSFNGGGTYSNIFTNLSYNITDLLVNGNQYAIPISTYALHDSQVCKFRFLNDFTYEFSFGKAGLLYYWGGSTKIFSISSIIGATYQEGYSAGYSDGSSSAYQQGYTDGFNQADNQDATALSIFTGIINVGLLPINVFLSIFNFEVFGIHIGGLVSAFLTISIVIILWRIIKGSKND